MEKKNVGTMIKEAAKSQEDFEKRWKIENAIREISKSSDKDWKEIKEYAKGYGISIFREEELC